MNRTVMSVMLALALPIGSAQAWDPTQVLNNAIHGQINQRINRGVSAIFKSIENPTTERRSPDSTVQGAAPGDIVLYGNDHCGYCKRAQQHMQNRGIPYVYKDVETDSQAEAEWRAHRARGVPVILIGDQVLQGFSAASFDKAYRNYQAAQGTSGAGGPTSSTSNASSGSQNQAYQSGDVLSARISKVKILAEAEPGARSLGLLAKNEEVIYLGESQGRYLKVQSAEQSGWVEQALVTKP